MKAKIFLFIPFIFLCRTDLCFGQLWQTDFETKNYSNIIVFDTISKTKNIWQIGKPQKNIFDSAYSPTHAILTDTLNPYPINDTSRFIIKFKIDHIAMPLFILVFKCKFNTDSLKDFGFIENTFDSGKTWINIGNKFYTGNSDGWNDIATNYSPFETLSWYGVDTVYFRFNFISDSIQTNKDGWMIDNIYISNYTRIDGVHKEQPNDYLITIYPNPAISELHIETTSNEKFGVQLFDVTGKKVMENIAFTNSTTINAQMLMQGLYFIRITDVNGAIVKTQKVAVVH